MRWNYFIPMIIFAGLAFLVMNNPKGNQGKLAPDFSAELIDGSAFKLSDLKGSYVLLDFWGSWCGPCRRKNKELVQLHQQFSEKKFKDAKDFKIVSVAIEKNDKNWKKAIEKDGLTWPHHILRTSRLVLSDPLALKYDVKDLPTIYLIGSDGTIISANASSSEISAYLAERVK